MITGANKSVRRVGWMAPDLHYLDWSMPPTQIGGPLRSIKRSKT